MRQHFAACTKLHCVEKLLAQVTFVCEYTSIIRLSIQNFRFHLPSKKRMVTQSSKPDDHTEGTLDLALICLEADHFPLNSTLDTIVGVVEPSWLRA